MNYIILNQFKGKPYLSFIGETCYTSSYGTYFYCVKPEDETKIHEVKALELLNSRHNHVLESVPQDEHWTVNKLVQLLQSKEDSYFIVYAGIDYKKALNGYAWSSIDDGRDKPIYSIISLDP